MGQTPGDDRTEPSLELPSLSLRGLGRRKRGSRASQEAAAPRQDVATEREDPAPADVPVGEPAPEPEAEEIARPPAYEAATEMATDGTADGPMDLEAPTGRRARERPTLTLPAVPGRVAAAVTGLVVGMAGALGTYGAIAGCKAVRGVGSCGGAPGFLILVAILALMVLFGMALLTALQVRDPGSTSFLAVGVVTVVVMLVLLDVVFSPWMFVVVPLLSAAAFLLAHWVTTRFEDEPGRRDWA